MAGGFEVAADRVPVPGEALNTGVHLLAVLLEGGDEAGSRVRAGADEQAARHDLEPSSPNFVRTSAADSVPPGRAATARAGQAGRDVFSS